MATIDLNCDLGEFQSDAQEALEAAIFPHISSCNIACGGHTGTEITMRKTIERALENHVIIGAHPSYPDWENFGRKTMEITTSDLLQSIKEQVDSLICVAKFYKAEVKYIKPHGALYNDLAQHTEMAKTTVDFLIQHFPNLAILGLPHSALEKACIECKYPFVAEAFADRAYTANGFLVPRSIAGAVIDDKLKAASQALHLAQGQSIESITGEALVVKAQSICVHGDSQNALDMVLAIRANFKQHQIQIQAFR